MAGEKTVGRGSFDCSSVLFRLRLIRDQRFRIGHTSFGMTQGAIVSALQIDARNKNVLLDFGDGLIDWVSQQTIRSCFDREIG